MVVHSNLSSISQDKYSSKTCTVQFLFLTTVPLSSGMVISGSVKLDPICWVGSDAVGSVGSDTVGSVGSDTVGSVGSDAVGSVGSGSDAVGSDAVGSDAVGSDAVGSSASRSTICHPKWTWLAH